jgi:hypothetical protein
VSIGLESLDDGEECFALLGLVDQVVLLERVEDSTLELGGQLVWGGSLGCLASFEHGLPCGVPANVEQRGLLSVEFRHGFLDELRDGFLLVSGLACFGVELANESGDGVASLCVSFDGDDESFGCFECFDGLHVFCLSFDACYLVTGLWFDEGLKRLWRCRRLAPAPVHPFTDSLRHFRFYLGKGGCLELRFILISPKNPRQLCYFRHFRLFQAWIH